MVGTGFSSLKHSVAASAILCGLLTGCASTEQHAQAGLSPAQTPAPANVPHPATVADASAPGVTEVAQAGSTLAQGEQTTLAKTGRLQPGQPLPGVPQSVATQTAQAQAAPGQVTDPAMLEQRMAQPTANQPQAASQGQAAIAAATGVAGAGQTAAAAYAEPAVPMVVAIPMPNPSRPGEEEAMRPLIANTYAEQSPIPLTPEMVAIQSVLPIPRPNEGPAFEPTEVALASPVLPLAYATRPQYDFNFDTSGPTVVPAVLDYSNDASAVSPTEKAYITKLIDKYAKIYQVPAALIHRVVHRESRYNPKAYNSYGYFGLMQIKYNTAKSMGYEGPPAGLLDAETNIKYAAKYLRGAWVVADGEKDPDNKQADAVGLYARGYYYEAKRKGLDDIANGDY